MNVNALKALDSSDLNRLIDLVEDYRVAVFTGEMSGYGQDKADELHDIDALSRKLRAAQ